MNATPNGRMALIDALKAVGSQFIVLHHLAFYGPMSDWTEELAPKIVGWFSQDARLAVQVFLVVAGFLSAHSLAPRGVLRVGNPLSQMWKRYARVALPYLAALLVSVLCTEIARVWMEHGSLPGLPTFWQWLTHALLLHGLLGVDSISAGVWYVAIDFQLYVLLLMLLWLPRKWQMAQWAGGGLVVAAVLLSLFYFNRDPVWDAWAMYFFGSYGLGVLTYWAMRPGADSPAWIRAAWIVLCVLVLAALLLHFRARIAVALGIAVLLGWAHRRQWMGHWPAHPLLAYLGQISYSVFLLNFPVALVVNAWFTRYMPADPVWQTAGVLLAWLACNLAGMAFYHGVETRLNPAAVRNLWIRLTQIEGQRNLNSGM